MNGLEPLIYGANSTGIRRVVAMKTVEGKINTIFKGTLTRNASYEEMQSMVALVEESPQDSLSRHSMDSCQHSRI